MAGDGWVHRGHGLLAGTLVLLMAACTNVHTVRQADPVREQYVVEMEMVPNARLVQVDTSPIWQLGANGFVAGADRLLVIRRTTRLGRGRNPNRPLRDRFYERVWITLPTDKQVGERLKIEDLEQRFLVSYDAGDVGDQQYRQPNRILGSLEVVEETPEAVTVRISMGVQPVKRTAWDVQGTFEVPVRPQGLLASRAPRDRILLSADEWDAPQPTEPQTADAAIEPANPGAADTPDTPATPAAEPLPAAPAGNVADDAGSAVPAAVNEGGTQGDGPVSAAQ